MLDIVGLDTAAHSLYSALLRGPATVAELAETTPLPPVSIQDTLDGLETKGLVNRMPGDPRGTGPHLPTWPWMCCYSSRRSG